MKIIDKEIFGYKKSDMDDHIKSLAKSAIRREATMRITTCYKIKKSYKMDDSLMS